MAKGDVTMQFDAQTASAVQQLLKLREQILNTADATRKFGEESGSAFENINKAAEKLAPSLAELTTGIGAIAGAVELAKGTFEGYLERSGEKAESLLQKVQGINAALAAGGQGAAGPEMRRQLEHLEVLGKAGSFGGLHIDPEQSSRIAQQISAQLGNTQTPAEKESAMVLAHQGLGWGLNEAQAGELGVIRGRLNHARHGETAAEIDQAAKTIFENGGLDEQALKYYERAKNKGQALRDIAARHQDPAVAGRGMIALQEESEQAIEPDAVLEAEKSFLAAHAGNAAAAGLDPKIREAAQAAIGKLPPHERHEVAKLKRGADHFTAEEARLLRNNAIAPGDREAAWRADPTLAPESVRANIRGLVEGAKRIPQTLGVREELQSHVDAMEDEDRAALRKRNADADAKWISERGEGGAGAALDREARKQELKNKMAENHAIFNALPGATAADAYLQVEWDAEPTFDDVVDEKPKEAGMDLNQRRRQAEPAAKGQSPGASAAWGAAHLDVLQDIRDGLRQTIAVTRTRRDVAMATDSPGQA